MFQSTPQHLQAEVNVLKVVVDVIESGHLPLNLEIHKVRLYWALGFLLARRQDVHSDSNRLGIPMQSRATHLGKRRPILGLAA